MIRHALTVHQPFASLIAGWPELDAYLAAGGAEFRPKRIENRDWPAPPMLRGQRLAIHAGKTIDEDAVFEVTVRILAAGLQLPDPLPLGCVVAVCDVVGYLAQEGATWNLTTWTGTDPTWAPATPQEVVDQAQDYWLIGAYGWLLDHVVRLPAPVPARGMQKVWTLPKGVAEAVEVHLHG